MYASPLENPYFISPEFGGGNNGGVLIGNVHLIEADIEPTPIVTSIIGTLDTTPINTTAQTTDQKTIKTTVGQNAISPNILSGLPVGITNAIEQVKATAIANPLLVLGAITLIVYLATKKK